jgi:6-phosphogluconolactonase
MFASSRRDFLRVAGVAAIAPYGLRHVRFGRGLLPFFVGTYTDGDSEGIYRCTFDTESGALAVEGVTGLIENPSYLAAHPSGGHLYAVSETSEFEGEPGGGVYAYSVDAQTNALSLLNAQRSHGGAPCYVTVTPDGGYVLVANYSGGNFAMLPVQADGSLAPASDVAQHEGVGYNEERQPGPLGHCIIVGPTGRAYAVDKGLDRVVTYDLEGGELARTGSVDVIPGSGPRHMVFHPEGPFAYVINEIASSVSAFRYEEGALFRTQTIATLPDDYEENNTTADVHVSVDGRFLYGSNRGHDSIAVYAIDAESGFLTPVQHVKTGGSTPRNFALDPTGRFLLAANQRTGNIVVFTRDAETGMLEEAGQTLSVPAPVCLRFLRTA